MTPFTDLEVTDDWVTITDDAREHEAIVRRDRIESIKVDWLVAGGSITLQIMGHRHHTVTFASGDNGQACADAISDLMKGMP